MVEQFEVSSGPFAENPYPILTRLREEAPVFWCEALSAFMVTRHADVERVVSNDSEFYPTPGGRSPEPGRNVVIMHGEDHRKLRKLLAPAFTPRALSLSIQPDMPRIAHALIDAFVGSRAADIVTEFANPLSASVVSRLLNVTAADEPWLMKAAEQVLEALADPGNAALQAQSRAVSAKLRGYFKAIVAREIRSPSRGVIADMIGAEVDGEKLSEADVVATVEALVIAGIETTQRLIANLLFALLQNRDQLTMVLADRALLKAAFDEALRFYPPNQFRMRYAACDLDMHGVIIKESQKVYAMTAGANRDPRVWKDPDTFDVRRFLQPGLTAHMSLGAGPHYCLGAILAKMETAAAMEALFDRVEDLRLDPKHEVRFTGFRNRSPEHLKVTFDVAAAV